MPRASARSLELHVATALHEYDSLRQESLNAIAARVQITGYVFTGLALVIVGVSVSDKVPDPVAAFVLLLLVPGLASLSMIGWLIEYRRSQRAGVGLAEIERGINLHIDRHRGTIPFRPSPLGWESGLIKRGMHTKTPYGMTLLLLFILGLSGSILGAGRLWNYLSQPDRPISPTTGVLVAALVSLALDAWFGYWCRKNWREARTDYATPSITRHHNSWHLDSWDFEDRTERLELRAWISNQSDRRRSARFHFYISDSAQLKGSIHLTSRKVTVQGRGSLQISVDTKDSIKSPQIVLFESETQGRGTHPPVSNAKLQNGSPLSNSTHGPWQITLSVGRSKTSTDA